MIWKLCAGLIAGLYVSTFSEAAAPDFIHATYLVGSRIENRDEIERTRFSQFNFIYLMASPDWTTEDFNRTDADLPQQLAAQHRFPEGDQGLSLVPALIDRAHRQGVKVLASIVATDTPLIASDATKRRLFAQAMAAFVAKYGFDGLEVDWERSLHLDNYMALMQELRSALNALPPTRTYYLTTALHTSPHFPAGQLPERQFNAAQAAQLCQAVDWINIMTYDMSGGVWGKTASHNTPLNRIQQVVPQRWAAFPPEKLCIGLASYGFKYTGIKPDQPQTNRLSESGRYCTYTELAPLLAQGWTERFEPGAEAPYYFSPDQADFITIDNPRSLTAKVQWVLSRHYRGVFWWEFHCDYLPADGQTNPQHPLVDAVEPLLPPIQYATP